MFNKIMASDSTIGQYLPDPFYANNNRVAVPLSGISHTNSLAVLTGVTGPGASGFVLSAGRFSAPIVISPSVATGGNKISGAGSFASWTGPYWTLPSANQLFSTWGQGPSNSAYALGTQAGNPNRLGSERLVNVDDVFQVPVINLSKFPQIFKVGTGGSANGIDSNDSYVVIPAYGQLATTGSAASTGPASALSNAGASALTFQVSAINTVSGSNAYNVY